MKGTACFVTTVILAMMATITSLPSAHANPGHELNIQPLVAQQGAPRTLNVVADEATPAIIITRYFVYMDLDEDLAVPNNPNTCNTLTAEAGDRLWELQDADGDRVGTRSQAVAAGQSASAVIDTAPGFGSGDFTTSVEDTTSPTITFINTTGGVLTDGDPAAPDLQFRWRDGDDNPDDTETVSLYHFAACGFVDINRNGVFDSRIDLPDVIVETFRTTSIPVGGEILPIDIASLFMAGTVANAQTMIMVLGCIAGIVVFLTKLRRK